MYKNFVIRDFKLEHQCGETLHHFGVSETHSKVSVVTGNSVLVDSSTSVQLSLTQTVPLSRGLVNPFPQLYNYNPNQNLQQQIPTEPEHTTTTVTINDSTTL